MRKILELPEIRQEKIDRVSKLIDDIADNIDRDCSYELKELQSLTGKPHKVEEFAEYWGWTDLDLLARMTLMPEPPCVDDLDRTELETIIGIIRESVISGEDDKGKYYAGLLHKSLAAPDALDCVMSGQDVKTVADKLLSAKNHIIVL